MSVRVHVKYLHILKPFFKLMLLSFIEKCHSSVTVEKEFSFCLLFH